MDEAGVMETARPGRKLLLVIVHSRSDDEIRWYYWGIPLIVAIIIFTIFFYVCCCRRENKHKPQYPAPVTPVTSTPVKAECPPPDHQTFVNPYPAYPAPSLDPHGDYGYNSYYQKPSNPAQRQNTTGNVEMGPMVAETPQRD